MPHKWWLVNCKIFLCVLLLFLQMLHQQKMCNCDIVRRLGIAASNVSWAIKEIENHGYTGRHPGSGKKRTVNTPRVHQNIKKRLQRNPKVSMGKIGHEIGVSCKLACRIAKEHSKVKPYKLQNVQARATSKLSLAPLPIRFSTVELDFVHRWEALHRQASAQPAKRQILVC